MHRYYISRVLPISMLLAFFCCCFLANAQSTRSEQSQYFRYFLLQAESVDETDLDNLQKATERHEAIRIYQSCPVANQVLFSVSADYPHRIDAISAEIESMFLAKSKKSVFKSIAAVPVSEISNFCK
jgi:hypothetical protein